MLADIHGLISFCERVPADGMGDLEWLYQGDSPVKRIVSCVPDMRICDLEGRGPEVPSGAPAALGPQAIRLPLDRKKCYEFGSGTGDSCDQGDPE
jgi:hypothetical protein